MGTRFLSSALSHPRRVPLLKIDYRKKTSGTLSLASVPGWHGPTCSGHSPIWCPLLQPISGISGAVDGKEVAQAFLSFKMDWAGQPPLRQEQHEAWQSSVDQLLARLTHEDSSTYVDLRRLDGDFELEVSSCLRICTLASH